MSVCLAVHNRRQTARRGQGSGGRPAARWVRGATLVELLTSMVVASILMVALMQSLASTSDSWTRQSKHFSAQREARVAMRMLADDLAAMVPVPGWARQAATLQGNPELDPMQPTAGMNDPSGWPGQGADPGDRRTGFLLEAAPSPTGSARLAFLRAGGTRTGEAAGFDLRLVMYGVAMSFDGSASGLVEDAFSQKLVRREFSGEETFRRLRGLLGSSGTLVTAADWAELEAVRDQAGVAAAGVVAHDVIRFDARLFRDLTTPNQPLARNPWELARWMDVSLRVTNRQTGQHLKTTAVWRGEGERSALLLNGTPEEFLDDPEVRTYSARVLLPAATL